MVSLRVFGTVSVMALLVIPLSGRGDQRVVSDIAALRAAIAAAQPGDVIVMKNGTWADAEIAFDATGTEAAPIRLRAQAPGSVILTGSSTLTFAGPHLVAEGLLFEGGALRAGTTVVRFASHHGRLTDSAIVDYNVFEDNTLTGPPANASVVVRPLQARNVGPTWQ